MRENAKEDSHLNEWKSGHLISWMEARLNGRSRRSFQWWCMASDGFQGQGYRVEFSVVMPLHNSSPQSSVLDARVLLCSGEAWLHTWDSEWGGRQSCFHSPSPAASQKWQWSMQRKWGLRAPAAKWMESMDHIVCWSSQDQQVPVSCKMTKNRKQIMFSSYIPLAPAYTFPGLCLRHRQIMMTRLY